MATGKHSSSEITVTYDDSPGGTGRAIQSFILTMGGAKIEAGMQVSTALGDAWEKFNPTGLRKMPAITLTGFWDDTVTTGPHTVLRVVDGDIAPEASTRTLVIVFGNSKTLTVETRLVSYEVLGKTNNLTEFSAVIQPVATSASVGAVWS